MLNRSNVNRRVIVRGLYTNLERLHRTCTHIVVYVTS